MKAFANLLDRLAYEPGRSAKLRLMTDYFATTPDPERGWALAALTGALRFAHAKPGLIRALIAARSDPVLFSLSYDYVGDLSETVALMWPRPEPAPSPDAAPNLADVVTTLATLGKAQLPAQLARWLDGLDATGRWALLKLVTGALRIGVSARLAKTAVAALKPCDPDEIELIWPGLAAPYEALFAWLEGRSEKPQLHSPVPFRPVMLAHPIPRTSRVNGNGTAFVSRRWRPRSRAARLCRGFILEPARIFPPAFPISSRRCALPPPSMANCSFDARAGSNLSMSCSNG
jgi:DNA ligase 1